MRVIYLLVVAAVLMCLPGCQTVQPAKVETVTVDKPIAYIPKPPSVPAFDSMVDKLTPADVADPGKVGQAYKYDTATLRALLAIYRSIVEQYANSSYNFDNVKTQIDKLYQSVPSTSQPVAK